MAKNPVVTFQMKDGGVIKAELYPEIAPNTVNNFISLVNHNFYDGLIFHRVIRGFMIQGGCPDGTGMGGPGYTIRGEFAYNGVKNDLKHTACPKPSCQIISPVAPSNIATAGVRFTISLSPSFSCTPKTCIP